MGKVQDVTNPRARVTAQSLEPPLRNRQIAELLASEGEKTEGYVRKAFYRAAHAAFMWPEEAWDLTRQNRSLTELTGVGPFLAKTILKWLENPPAQLEPPPEVRRNFLTLTEAREILSASPEWREEVKGDLQMHSNWSDGSGSIEEMAMAGIARGYEYISITDHTKGLKIAGGINETELAEQASEIDQINTKLKQSGKSFQVLHSVEMNLSPTGEGDMDPDALGKLDLVLGSFHSQLRKTTDQTDRYLAGLDNPNIQILGHPRGRVYNYRLGLKADWARVFAHAATLDKAVEVDAYSDRQDLDLELLQIAREQGVRISFGSDSHHPWQLAFLDLALAAALLAGIPRDRIINFLPAKDLLKWVTKIRSQ
jgi:histidinol phosphatase-like PHP family hydrolase